MSKKPTAPPPLPSLPPPPAQTYASVADAAAATPDLSTLLAAVKAAGLADKLSKGNMSITLFAPTNTAFDKYLASKNKTAAQLLASPSLKWILKQHIVKGAVKAADVKNGTVKSWLPNSNLTLAVSPTGAVTVSTPRSSATVTKADIHAGSAIIHIVDGVLLPTKEAVAEAPARAAAWWAAKKAAKSPAMSPAAAMARKLAERV